MADETEIAAVVLQPHFDAVRDVFGSFEPAPGKPLDRLRRTQLLVTAAARDAERHYARCREDGREIQLAPEAANLGLETLVALLSHEFGHAADFAYPGDWVLLHPREQRRRAVWIGGRTDEPARRWRRIWHDREVDEVEWCADAIAETVTGLPVRYCGPCLLQCFRGAARPPGLR